MNRPLAMCYMVMLLLLQFTAINGYQLEVRMMISRQDKNQDIIWLDVDVPCEDTWTLRQVRQHAAAIAKDVVEGKVYDEEKAIVYDLTMFASKLYKSSPSKQDWSGVVKAGKISDNMDDTLKHWSVKDKTTVYVQFLAKYKTRKAQGKAGKEVNNPPKFDLNDKVYARVGDLNINDYYYDYGYNDYQYQQSLQRLMEENRLIAMERKLNRFKSPYQHRYRRRDYPYYH